MATVTYCKMQENNFITFSEDWTSKIERKFGASAGKQFAEVLNDQYASKEEVLEDLEDDNWNESLIMNRLHNYKSAYINRDFCNTFYITLKAIINGKDYMSNGQQLQLIKNNIFDECIRRELEKIGYAKQDIMRISWRVNSFCLIYSRSIKNWCIGKIIKIFIHNKTNQEWFHVKYGKKIKDIQRFCKYIKPIINDNHPLPAPLFTNKKTTKTTKTKQYNNGLIFHFYGLKAPKSNNYKSHIIMNDFLFQNLNKSLLTTINSSLQKYDTVLSLKKLIRKIFDISAEHDMLIIFGDNIISTNNKLKLRNFGISNNSLLLVAINCDNINNKIINNKNGTDMYNYTLSIKTRKGFDIITQEANRELFKMPVCGHYMHKQSLYQYALNQLKDANKVEIKCPHKNNDETDMKYEWSCTFCTFLNDIDEDVCEMCENAKAEKKLFCEAKWNYCLLKQILLFNDENNWLNSSKLELLLARNKMQKECEVQKCPRCQTLHYRNDNSYLWSDIKTKSDIKKTFKTECRICQNVWNNSFCFCCGEEWSYAHVCDSSFKSDVMQIINKAETKQIGDVHDVPSIRFCPNCFFLIKHTEACKHMECSQCETDFCFVCLSVCVDGQWQCGSSGAVCPVARQNINALPNTIVINKKIFHLF